MRHRRSTEVIGALSLVALFGAPALAETRTAELNGFKEVPSISTAGTGTFTATINDAGTLINYELSYGGLSSDVQYAHIHFSKRGVNGGVAAFLCGGGGKPACPASGTVTDVIDADDVDGPTEQGIAAGELGELIEALRHRAAYVNVHTDTHPGGEIRGNVK